MTTTISGSSGIVFPDLTTMQTGQQAVKAWVNFNGTGTVAIRAGYNVSSITDNGTGIYTVNFTAAMSDANFAATCIGGTGTAVSQVNIISDTGSSTTSFTLLNAAANGAGVDRDYFSVSIFR